MFLVNGSETVCKNLWNNLEDSTGVCTHLNRRNSENGGKLVEEYWKDGSKWRETKMGGSLKSFLDSAVGHSVVLRLHLS